MKILRKEDIKKGILPGRHVLSAVGKGAAIESTAMSLGWARFAGEYGPMEPHCHAEESMIVVDVKNGYIRIGESKENLGARIPLKKDMVLHMPASKWHVFECDEGGYLEIVYFYGQADNIRPEKVKD